MKYKTLITFTSTLVTTLITPAQSVDPVTELISQFTLSEGAEIAAYDPTTETAFVTSGEGLQVVDMSDPANPSEGPLILPSSFGFENVTTNDITSVAVGSGRTAGFIAISIPAATVTDNGCVLILTNTGAPLECLETGALPDMVTFTRDGSKLLVANEGQSAGEENEPLIFPNPEGSVTIIDFSDGLISPEISTADFSAFDIAPEGVRVFSTFSNNASIDFEPEFISISSDNSTAYVTLQENNSVAVLDIASATFTDILPLGLKDHSLPGNGLDASNRDNGINIQNWPVFGMYMPDALDTYVVNGETFFVTANEGDSRDFDVSRGADLVDGDLTNGEVDPTTDQATLDALADDAQLGRLEFSNIDGDTDEDGFIEVLQAFGGRSFSIWDSAGNQVYDSGDDFAQITAELTPDIFNSDESDPDEFDDRSDDAGPEPEGITIGNLNGKTYAFIGLERVGGVMIYDISDPASPSFIEYRNVPGDQGPEGLAFINPDESPTGEAFILVTNEDSNTLTTLSFNPPFSLTLLHNNDGESSIFPDVDPALGTGADSEFGGAATFVTLVDQERAAAINSVMLSSGDNFLPGTVVDAGIAASVPFSPVVDYNANLINEIGYDALAIGNHDFDLGPDFLADFIGVTIDVPFLSANIDFSPEENLQTLVDSGRIARSTIIAVSDEQVGIIGAITEGLAAITNQGDVIISAVEAAVEAEVASLESQGINKIILVSHLQGIAQELALIGNITGVDVVIAGGGDEILDTGDGANLLPTDVNNVFGTYPLIEKDESGEDVYVVTTPGNYRYLGRLEIEFDSAGNVLNISDNSELVRNARVDGLTEDADTLTNVVTPVENFISTAVVVANSDVELDTSRPNIRAIQTNMGAIAADAMLVASENQAAELNLNDDYIIALTNGGGIRTDRLYPVGDLTDQTIANIFPFGNTINAVTGMTTIELLSVLEHAVASVEFASGQWGHIAGFTISYNPAAQGQTTVETSADSGVFTIDTPGERIVDVFLSDGTQIVANGIITSIGSSLTYTFVTNNFILGNGDRYPLGTILEDTYTEFPNVVIDNFGDANGDGEIDYADVAQSYLSGLPDTDSDTIPNITIAQYAEESVINRIVATDPTLGADQDEDGINDAWEQLLIDTLGDDSVSTLADVDATTDFDNDGTLDIDQFLADIGSVISENSITITNSGFLNGFFFIDVETGTSGLKVVSSNDLEQPFSEVSNVIPESDENNLPIRFLIPEAQLNPGKDFFRVIEE